MSMYTWTLQNMADLAKTKRLAQEQDFRWAGGLKPGEQQALEQRNLNKQLEAKTGLAQTAAEQAKFNLQMSKEAWDLKKKQAASMGKLATRFMSQWSNSLQQVGKMYGGATDLLNSAMKAIASGGTTGGTGTGIPGFDDVLKNMQDSYNDYQTTFKPYAEQFLQQAGEEANMRARAAQRLEQYATPDYAGVRGQAAADVATKGQMAREALTRQMLGMGINPASGKFGALTRKSYLDQARDTAIAMNLATRAEKQRAAGATVQQLAALHPETTAGVATNLLKTGQNLLTNQGALAKAAADVQTSRINAIGNIANTAGNLATGYAKAITEPQAEMAGYFMGQAGNMA